MPEELSTEELQSTLSKREGVTTVVVAPYAEYSLTISGETYTGTGPCVITINVD